MDRKRKEEEKKKKEKKKKKIQRIAISTFYHLNPKCEAVMPNVLQNDSSSTREAAPSEEPEPELFLKEPEPGQTAPKQFTTPCSYRLPPSMRLATQLLASRDVPVDALAAGLHQQNRGRCSSCDALSFFLGLREIRMCKDKATSGPEGAIIYLSTPVWEQ